MRLIDFNPVFGTTSPLLFDWDELPYGAAPTPAAPERAQHDGCEQSQAALQPASPADAQPAAWPAASVNGDSTSHASIGGWMPSAITGDTSDMQELTGAGEGQAHANGHSQPAGVDPSSCEVLFRFASADSALRPNAAVYGAPFEMADMSQGGAIDELLKRLQVEHQDTD